MCLILKIFDVHLSSIFCVFFLCTFFAFFASADRRRIYIRYCDNIGYPRYGESYNIGDNQYSSKNLSYCPINRFLVSVPFPTIWLTTAEMGFSLTEEQDVIVCPKDVKEGKVNDRYLAPAISRFAADMRRKVGTGACPVCRLCVLAMPPSPAGFRIWVSTPYSPPHTAQHTYIEFG